LYEWSDWHGSYPPAERAKKLATDKGARQVKNDSALSRTARILNFESVLRATARHALFDKRTRICVLEDRYSLPPRDENIAKVVAEGIALGREEGIAMAVDGVARLKDENNA
jgi:hypothetical protein